MCYVVRGMYYVRLAGGTVTPTIRALASCPIAWNTVVWPFAGKASRLGSRSRPGVHRCLVAICATKPCRQNLTIHIVGHSQAVSTILTLHEGRLNRESVSRLGLGLRSATSRLGRFPLLCWRLGSCHGHPCYGWLAWMRRNGPLKIVSGGLVTPLPPLPCPIEGVLSADHEPCGCSVR